MRHRLAALAAATVLIALPAGTAGAAPGAPALLHTDGPALNLGGPLSADLAYGTEATMYDPGTTTGVRCATSHIGGTLAVDPNPRASCPARSTRSASAPAPPTSSASSR